MDHAVDCVLVLGRRIDDCQDLQCVVHMAIDRRADAHILAVEAAGRNGQVAGEADDVCARDGAFRHNGAQVGRHLEQVEVNPVADDRGPIDMADGDLVDGVAVQVADCCGQVTPVTAHGVDTQGRAQRGGEDVCGKDGDVASVQALRAIDEGQFVNAVCTEISGL